MISSLAITTPETHGVASQALKFNTKRRFSAAANQYVEHANVQKQAAADLFKLMNMATPTSNGLCVDLGAGPLVNTYALQAKFAQVIAMDLSLSMLKSNPLSANRICADMDHFPFQANSIDVVFSNFALQWSANFQGVMHALYEALKPGGQAYISTVVAGSLNEIKSAFSALDSHQHINHFETEQNIDQMVKKAGFTVTRREKLIYSDTFASPLQAIRSIKAIGATTQNQPSRRNGLLTKQALQTVCNAYPLINNQAHVSYHVVLLSLAKAKI